MLPTKLTPHYITWTLSTKKLHICSFSNTWSPLLFIIIIYKWWQLHQIAVKILTLIYPLNDTAKALNINILTSINLRHHYYNIVWSLFVPTFIESNIKNMPNVKCLYCSADIPDTSETCPQCQAPSHFQTHGQSLKKQKKFIRNFILLVIFVAIIIVWLPR